MPRGSRAFHTKSRNGCGQCKKRHVKCDLQAPICKNCKRRGEKCDYQLLSEDTSPPERRKSPASNTLVLSRVNTHLHSRQEHHDRTVGIGILAFRPGATFSLLDDEGQIWDAELAHQVHRQAFLQHNVLAIASLHSHLTSSPRPSSGNLYAAACAHHLEASRLFRQDVAHVSAHTWLPALVFAIGVGIFHFGISKSEPATSVMESMFVLRSAAVLAGQVTPWFRASGLQCVIKDTLSSSEAAAAAAGLDAETVLAYERLTEYNSLLVEDESAREVYEAAISALREWLVMTSGTPRTWMDFIWWPSKLNSGYMSHLARREPMALLVFIYWCAVMNNCPKRWFLDGWAVRVASPIIDTLGPEWEDALQWPRKVLRLGNDHGDLEIGHRIDAIHKAGHLVNRGEGGS